MKLGSTEAKSVDDLGKNRPKPGTYLAVVKHVDDTFEKNPDKLVVEFEIISGTVPGQAGKTHSEWYSTEAKHIVRITRLAMCCGILQPGEERDVDLQLLKGKALVICIEEHAYKDKLGNDKTGSQITYHGMWPIDHAEVKDVPKDKEALAIIGMRSQQPAAGSAAPSQPAQQSLPGTQQAPAAGGKWSGI